MAKFFVGQMVRYVRAGSTRSRRYVGTETRIAALSVLAGHYFRGLQNAVSADAALDIRVDGAGWLLANFDQLEPILPDGHRAGEEGTCEPLDKLLSEVRDREAV